MIFTAAIVDAQTAKQFAIVLEVLPRDQLLAHVKKIAGQIAAMSRGAVAEAKRVLNEGYNLAPSVARSIEQGIRRVLWNRRPAKSHACVSQ